VDADPTAVTMFGGFYNASVDALVTYATRRAGING